MTREVRHEVQLEHVDSIAGVDTRVSVNAEISLQLSSYGCVHVEIKSSHRRSDPSNFDHLNLVAISFSKVVNSF
jgi:hypothetical protein